MAKTGRPRLNITRQQIADAAIAMGLPDITIVGVAARLGVSHMTLYNHVPNLESLRSLAAEEVFLRWPLGRPMATAQGDMQGYLEQLSRSMWRLVKTNPGIAPYLLREDLLTPAMRDKILAHQRDIAGIFGISEAKSTWLFMTVCHVCVSVADTLQPPAGSTPDDPLAEPIDPRYLLGIKALIIGALQLLPDLEA